MGMDLWPFPITKSPPQPPAREVPGPKAVRDRHVADKELIKTVPRGTLLHRIWGCGFPPAATAQSSEGKGQGQWVEGQERAQAGTFLWGPEDSVEGMRSSGDRLLSAHPSSNRERPALGGSDLSWLEGVPAGAVGDLTQAQVGCSTAGGACRFWSQ